MLALAASSGSPALAAVAAAGRGAAKPNTPPRARAAPHAPRLRPFPRWGQGDYEYLCVVWSGGWAWVPPHGEVRVHRYTMSKQSGGMPQLVRSHVWSTAAGSTRREPGPLFSNVSTCSP